MSAIEDLISNSDPEMLVCRIDRHAYDRRLSTVEMEGRVFVWTRTCGRCGVKRTQRLRPDGTIINNIYVYPKSWPKISGGAPDKGEMGIIRLFVVGKNLA